MKKHISIASIIGLFLANIVSADILPPPGSHFASSIGIFPEYFFIVSNLPIIILIISVITVFVFITRKIENKIKKKNNNLDKDSK